MRGLRSAIQRYVGPHRFFLAAVGTEDQLRQEVFYLGYHLHWPYAEIISLETDERRAYLRLLSEQIERENEAINRSARRTG